MARQLRRSGALGTMEPSARRAPPRIAFQPNFGARGTGVFQGIWQFLLDVRGELRKVVWPTREEIVKLTILVVGISLVIGAILGALDLGFTSLFQWLVTG